MAKKIKSVKVGSIPYKVVYVSELVSKNPDGSPHVWLGDVNFGKRRIRIATKTNAEPMQISTIFHEALHAILFQAGHHKLPESVFLALEYALPQFMRDNPELIKRMLKDGK